MSFKTEEEAKEKICVFRQLGACYMATALGKTEMFATPDEVLDFLEDYAKCLGSECAQYGRGVHRCGLV
jgi:hypothetical protein